MKRRGALGALFTALSWVVSALSWVPAARADGLAPDERARLAEGGVVRRPLDVDLPEGPYFGGVSYAVVDAPAGDVMRALLDVRALRVILPRTLEAKEVGKKGDSRLVFFRHGGRFGTASYTAIVRRESPSLLRFWLDPAMPHDIEDCWGYFRVEALSSGKTLLTYAALLRLEAGLLRLLFSEKIRSLALDTPVSVQRYFARRTGV